METSAEAAISTYRAELPSMVATLCSCEGLLGPYHPQTLHLMTHIAIAHWHAGESHRACLLLERAVEDLNRHLGRTHDLRLHALTALRDVLVAEGDNERASVVQGELLECHIQRLGSGHPDTIAARADLTAILLGSPDFRGPS